MMVWQWNRSIRSEIPDKVSGRRSITLPGLRPVATKVVPPARQASSIFFTTPSQCFGGAVSERSAVDTTFLPEARKRHTWSTSIAPCEPGWEASEMSGSYAMKLTQSASSRSNASMSCVAFTPAGGSPQSSPASRPALIRSDMSLPQFPVMTLSAPEALILAT